MTLSTLCLESFDGSYDVLVYQGIVPCRTAVSPGEQVGEYE